MEERLNDQELVRRQKVEKLKELGIDPFGQAYERTHYSTDIKELVKGKTNEEVSCHAADWRHGSVPGRLRRRDPRSRG